MDLDLRLIGQTLVSGGLTQPEQLRQRNHIKNAELNILAGSVLQANKSTYDIIFEHMVMKPSGVTQPYVSL